MAFRAAGVTLDRAFVDAVDAVLPQTQCTRCGFPDCRGYAEAVAAGTAPINRCPPGGHEGVLHLARLTGRAALPLDPAHGTEGPRLLALIDEDACIGCTLCLQACPVDCISLGAVTGERTGWQAWSGAQAGEARRRHGFRRDREARERHDEAARLAAASPPTRDAGTARPGRSAVVEAALARARAARAV